MFAENANAVLNSSPFQGEDEGEGGVPSVYTLTRPLPERERGPQAHAHTH